MTEFAFILLSTIGATMIVFWLIVGGEGED
jgi:hypothetical protein